MLPDGKLFVLFIMVGIPSQCTYRCVVLPDAVGAILNVVLLVSQCTYRCVVLPDAVTPKSKPTLLEVSMHLQVRGAP